MPSPIVPLNPADRIDAFEERKGLLDGFDRGGPKTPTVPFPLNVDNDSFPVLLDDTFGLADNWEVPHVCKQWNRVHKGRVPKIVMQIFDRSKKGSPIRAAFRIAKVSPENAGIRGYIKVYKVMQRMFKHEEEAHPNPRSRVTYNPYNPSYSVSREAIEDWQAAVYDINLNRMLHPINPLLGRLRPGLIRNNFVSQHEQFRSPFSDVTNNATQNTFLDFWGCRDTFLFPEVQHFPRLTNLDLRGNDIAELPEQVTKLTTLQVLNLSGNPIDTFPRELAVLVRIGRLRQLNLRGTPLTMEKVPRAYRHIIRPEIPVHMQKIVFIISRTCILFLPVGAFFALNSWYYGSYTIGFFSLGSLTPIVTYFETISRELDRLANKVTDFYRDIRLNYFS